MEVVGGGEIKEMRMLSSYSMNSILSMHEWQSFFIQFSLDLMHSHVTYL